MTKTSFGVAIGLLLIIASTAILLGPLVVFVWLLVLVFLDEIMRFVDRMQERHRNRRGYS